MKRILPTLFILTAAITASAQTEATHGLLTGTTTNVKAAKNTIATLKKGADGIGFYPITSTTTIKANTAYVAEPRQLLIDLSTLDNPLVGIEKVKSDGANRDKGESYDLSGRRTTSHHKGVVITNHRKLQLQLRHSARHR